MRRFGVRQRLDSCGMRKATAGRKACWLVLSRAKLLCVSEFRLLCMREPVLDRRNGRRCYSVAMVAACPFPANHGTPGAIREMSETLAQMGHTVHIVTYSGGQDDIVVRFAKVHRPSPFRPQRNVKVGPSAEKFLLDFAVLRLLCRLIQREPIDIIHGHNYEGAVIGALAGWITRRPVLYHAVNLMSDELPGYRFIRPEWLVKRVAGLLDWLIPIFPDHIIALSPELKEWLVTNGTPERKVDVVPCGVNPDIFNSAAPANLGTSFQIRNRPIVMYTGVLNRFQRIDYLLRGFAIALNQEPDALLLIVSPVVSEADKREHTKLAHKLGISHAIRWIGPHLLEDLPGYLALANVTVISRPDCLGHPIKLLNYMLAGKPIVCFQGAAKGVRHMYDAFIAPDHDCDALGKGIVTLLRNPTLAAQLGAQARATVLATFHWRHICVDIERIYHKLVEAANQQNRSGPSARKWANVLPVESANNSKFERDVGFSRLSQPVENPAMINDKKARD